MVQDRGSETLHFQQNAATEAVTSAILAIGETNPTSPNGMSILFQPTVDIHDLLKKKQLTPQEVRDGLGQFIWKHRPATIYEERAVDSVMVNNPQLFVDHAPIKNNQIRYYGRDFLINGLDIPNATISEISIGLLAIRDESDKLIGFLDLSPTHFGEDCGTEVVSVANFDTIRPHYMPNITDEKLAIETFDEFLNEERAIMHLPYGRFNLSVLPLQGRLHVWQMARSDKQRYIDDEENPLQLFLQTVGPDALTFVELIDGDRELIDNITQTMGQIDVDMILGDYDIARNSTNLIVQTVRTLAEAVHLAHETAAAIIPKNELANRPFVRETYEYLTATLKDLAKELAQTTITSNWDGERTFYGLFGHYLGSEAYRNTMNELYSLHHSDTPVPLLSFDMNEIPAIDEFAASFPHAKNTRSVLLYQWLVSAISNQQGINPEERKAWLRSFYKRVIGLGVYHEKASAYADSDREVPRYANALETLVDKGILPAKFNYLTLGCGDGLRVDKPAFDILRAQRPEIIPNREQIWGVDMVDSPEKWEDMQFIQHTVEDLLKDRPDLAETMDLVSVIGSPLNNMNLINEQIRYLQTIAGLLKTGGIAMFEVGSEQPAAEFNARVRRMKHFNAIFPYQPTGSLPINSAYRQPNDEPDEVGAFIPPESIYVAMAHMLGLELISPPPDPTAHAELVGYLQNPAALQKQTIEGEQNAFTSPYYMEDAKNWHEGKPLGARAALFFKKVGPPLIDLEVLFLPTFTPLSKSF